MFRWIKAIALISVIAFNPIQTKPINSYPLPVQIVPQNFKEMLFTSTSMPVVSSIPTVVLHGLESSSAKMLPFCEWLSDSFGINVFNLEIGNGEKTSLYTPLNKQLDELCQIIYTIPELVNGFNFIGMSQGGLLARGYVERCNLFPVINLITLVSPHGGEFIKNNKIDMYSEFAQDHLSVAGYWRDPLRLKDYLARCTYLPMLNNEFKTAESLWQKEQIKGLSNFVLIWSPYDQVLTPAESGKFSFLDTELKVIPLIETDLYKNDLLGLKYLNENNRLHMYETNCSHTDHRNAICFAQLFLLLKPFIKLN